MFLHVFLLAFSYLHSTCVRPTCVFVLAFYLRASYIAKPRMCPRRFTKTPGVLANRLENTHRSSRHIRCFQDTCQDAKVPPQDTFSRHLFKTPVKRHSKNLLDTAKKHKCFSRHLGEFSRDTQMCLEKHKGVLKRCLENFTCVLKAKKLTS